MKKLRVIISAILVAMMLFMLPACGADQEKDDDRKGAAAGVEEMADGIADGSKEIADGAADGVKDMAGGVTGGTEKVVDGVAEDMDDMADGRTPDSKKSADTERNGSQNGKKSKDGNK